MNFCSLFNVYFESVFQFVSEISFKHFLHKFFIKLFPHRTTPF